MSEMREYTIPDWFAKKEYKTATDVLTYLADQYYIYGEDRSRFMTWTSGLRAAVSRDAMHFEEYYENPQYRNHMDMRTRSPWHQTERVLENIFQDVEEFSSYQIEERNWMDEFLLVIYKSWMRAKKENFKRKLNGKDDASLMVKMSLCGKFGCYYIITNRSK
jgi:hypothetical protein